MSRIEVCKINDLWLQITYRASGLTILNGSRIFFDIRQPEIWRLIEIFIISYANSYYMIFYMLFPKFFKITELFIIISLCFYEILGLITFITHTKLIAQGILKRMDFTRFNCDSWDLTIILPSILNLIQ